ncbi:MAG: hypothetical protein QOJ50_2605, partial [Cryptosporangiaceae bacterium]|nr:hypothetical protein [Cryptosporangiaceae bacterium]
RRLLSIGAMYLGGLAGALLVLHGQPALSLLFAVLLLVIVCGTAWRLTRSSKPWTQPVGPPPPAPRSATGLPR